MTNARNTGIYGRVNPGPGFGDEYSYTDDVVLTAAQDGAVINNAGAAKAITVTLPAAIAGMEFSIQRIANFAITVATAGTDTVSGSAPGGVYFINSRGLTVLSCRANGGWETVVAGDQTGVYNIKDSGAVGNGVVDDTAAIQKAYDDAPNGSVVVWPGRATYKVTGQLNLRKNFVTTRFDGGGEDNGVNAGATTLTGCCILHVPASPSGNNILFDVANAAPSTTQLNSPSFIGNVLIYSTDTTYSKTAFKFTNVSRPYFQGRIHIAGATGQGSYYKGSTGGDGGSVGLYFLGREQYNFDNLLVYAEVPLRFGKNPSSLGGQYDMDHVYFSNAILAAGPTAPSTLKHTCILIDNDVRVVVATFDGHMALVGGKHKFYWKPTDNLSVSNRLTFRNVLTEQGTDATAYSFHIEFPDTSTYTLENLVVENSILGTDQYGVYTKNVQRVFLRGVTGQQTTGQKLLKCEGAHASYSTESIGWDDIKTNATAPASIIDLPADLILSYAGQMQYGSARVIPTSARYVKNDTDLGARRANFRTGAIGIYSHYATLAPTAKFKIPVNSNQRGVILGSIDVTACSDTVTNTILIGGRIAIAATDGGVTGMKVAYQDAGGLLEVGAATAGKLSVTSGARIAADLVITNNHATETLKILVEAHYVSSTWN